MEDSEPTFEQLKAERAREWASAQETLRQQMTEMHARLSAMPDVRDAPHPDLPWSDRRIACPCGNKEFIVTRWNTVNGMRHRAELDCTQCQLVGTWDFGEKKWL